MVDESELKPCPFCGGEAFLHEIPPHTHLIAKFMPDHMGSWAVECGQPDCGTGLLRDGREDAISAWNRRAPSPLSATTTRNLACIKLHLEIAEVSKRTQALMPSIVNFKDALRRLAEIEAALVGYDATQQKAPTDEN